MFLLIIEKAMALFEEIYVYELRDREIQIKGDNAHVGTENYIKGKTVEGKVTETVVYPGFTLRKQFGHWLIYQFEELQ